MHTIARLTLLAAALALPFAAAAHKAWLLPSTVTMSGESAAITVDAAVSNDLFNFNHRPLQLENLVVVAPDGTRVAPHNAATGRLRSVFDLDLAQQGTYRIAIVNAGLFASWTENGEPRRWRGTLERFATEVPKDANDLSVTQAAGRIETFVTLGAPSTGALAPTNVGIELVPVTHPNDLFAGERAEFKLLLDGKPAAGLKVTAIAGGTRYRDEQGEMVATTDAEGRFALEFPTAGMYWFETSTQDDKVATGPAKQRRASYAATIEVLPQ